jgi:hypothetical protein
VARVCVQHKAVLVGGGKTHTDLLGCILQLKGRGRCVSGGSMMPEGQSQKGRGTSIVACPAFSTVRAQANTRRPNIRSD